MSDEQVSRGHASSRAVAVLVGLVWIAMLALDWWMRFSWYGWQVTLVSRPAAGGGGPGAPMLRREVPERRGGDLTGLLGIPSVAERFGETKPAYTDVTDEFGFRNAPPSKGRSFPIVTAGDSFIASGATMSNTLSASLARISGEDVYNYAFAGRGPMFNVMHLLGDERFRESPPRVLVWGLVEREISGAMFSDMPYRLRQATALSESVAGSSRVNWSALLPAALKKSLPSSSAIAQLSSKAWNRVRYYVFGRISSEVAIARAPIEGKPVLFYTWAVRAMEWPPDVRRPDLIVRGIKELDDYVRGRGIALVVLLIPDKEQVYKDWLPEYLNPPSHPIPDSVLNAVENGLTQEGIRVVNLLGPYREQAGKDVLLYWQDDTHWNARGIDLAAALIWANIKELF